MVVTKKYLHNTMKWEQYVVTALISSGGDHSIHCWWDLIRSKQLSSVSVCHMQIFTRFSGHGNSIHDISPLLKKRKRTFIIFIHHFRRLNKNIKMQWHIFCSAFWTYRKTKTTWFLQWYTYTIQWTEDNNDFIVAFRKFKWKLDRISSKKR